MGRQDVDNEIQRESSRDQKGSCTALWVHLTGRVACVLTGSLVSKHVLVILLTIHLHEGTVILHKDG